MTSIDLQWFASAEEEGRTEQPSELKLKKAREEGRIPKSQELNGALVMMLAVIVLLFLANWLFENFVAILRFYFDRCTTAELNDGELGLAFLNYLAKMVLPIGLTAMVGGIAANLIQNKGFIYTTKKIAPKFSNIVPKFGEYFKKTLFSAEGAFNVVKSLLKITIIFVVAYLLIKSNMPKLLEMINVSLWSGVTFVAGLAAKLLIIASVIFLVISIPDYLMQKKQFMESMKMTKEEVKREFREQEGDPEIKGRLRRYQMELLNRNMPANVAKSDVVITNPTHFAVAVQYDRTKMPGPMVAAKGADELAQRIKQIARESDVPIVENVPLARALYAEVEIGDIIPEKHYNALVIILAQVYKMKGKI